MGLHRARAGCFQLHRGRYFPRRCCPSWKTGQMPQPELNHVTNLVEHFGDRCYAWDVVNEALSDSGTGNLADNTTWRSDIWYNTIGPGYVAVAFKAAEAAVKAKGLKVKLYYNDYNIESAGAKSTAAQALVKSLKDAGIQIDGVGLQSHFIVGETPSKAAQMANMQAFAALNLSNSRFWITPALSVPGSLRLSLVKDMVIFSSNLEDTTLHSSARQPMMVASSRLRCGVGNALSQRNGCWVLRVLEGGFSMMMSLAFVLASSKRVGRVRLDMWLKWGHASTGDAAGEKIDSDCRRTPWLCVSGGVQCDGEPIRCDGRRVLRSISDRSDPGPAKPCHQEPLCKAAKPSRMSAGVRCCTQNARLRPWSRSHSLIYRQTKKSYNVNKSRLSASVNSNLSAPSRCQLVPSFRLLASILPRTFAHTFVQYLGPHFGELPPKYKITSPRPELRSKPCSLRARAPRPQFSSAEKNGFL
ncbi:hypothetical protein KCU73_g142, partial [Aureobasidium melanogenum]